MIKRLLSFVIIITFALSANAQTVDTVVVSTKIDQTDQLWFNLDSAKVVGSASNGDWDLAFSIKGFSAAIRYNAAKGSKLYLYPDGDVGAWDTLDASDITNWNAWYDPANTWGDGAFNQGKTSSSVDLGWGTYSFVTHHVTGDSLFVHESSNGDLHKIWIDKLASGAYTFYVADTAGNNVDTIELKKSDFANRNFGYYQISTDSILKLEPADTTWDLHIGKYIADLNGTPYSVGGIRTNFGLQTAQVSPVDVKTYTDTNQTFQFDADLIGSDWKKFDLFGCRCYVISDSTVYFVKKDSATIYKLVMMGYGGNTSGDYEFSLEKLDLSIVGIVETDYSNKGNFLVYPNPSNGRNVSIITDLPKSVSTIHLSILNVNGQVVKSQQLQINNSFDVLPIQLDGFEAGMYFLQLNHENGSITKRLILK